MQKITPFLTFQRNAEEAINFYVSLFKNSKIHSITRYEQDDGMLPKGSLLHASFELDGQPFMAMDGGESFKFEQGFSIFVDCETQEEIDRLWEALKQGGGEEMCGWVRDRFGISWQIIPSVLGRYMTDPDPVKAGRVVQAMLKMQKLDIKTLQEAYESTEPVA